MAEDPSGDDSPDYLPEVEAILELYRWFVARYPTPLARIRSIRRRTREARERAAAAAAAGGVRRAEGR